MVNLNYISPLPRSPTPDRVWGTGKDPYPPPFTPHRPPLPSRVGAFIYNIKGDGGRGSPLFGEADAPTDFLTPKGEETPPKGG